MSRPSAPSRDRPRRAGDRQAAADAARDGARSRSQAPPSRASTCASTRRRDRTLSPRAARCARSRRRPRRRRSTTPSCTPCAAGAARAPARQQLVRRRRRRASTRASTSASRSRSAAGWSCRRSTTPTAKDAAAIAPPTRGAGRGRRGAQAQPRGARRRDLHRLQPRDVRDRGLRPARSTRRRRRSSASARRLPDGAGRLTMRLTLGCDHRVLTGAEGAPFLAACSAAGVRRGAARAQEVGHDRDRVDRGVGV